jgi:uncharacterized protein (TIGR03437 family)
MGFRAASDVPDTFLVTGVPSYLLNWHPLRNYPFDGTRRDISVNEVIGMAGRRTPDYTVSQRRFRFAFILVTAANTDPSAADLAKVDGFRRQFESFFPQASSGNGVADASLKRSMKLSVFPAAGVVPDSTAPASLTLETPAASDLTIQLQAPHGFAAVPASVRIPAGARTAAFSVTGVRPGVEELSAVPSDSAYETAAARIQVADASLLNLVAVSGDRQVAQSADPLPDPVVVRLTDANNLAYAGARIAATASAGGAVSPAETVTDSRGQASFRWTPGSSPTNQLQMAVSSLPSVRLTLNAGSAVPVVTSIVNAASFETGISPGGLAALGGVNLAGGATTSASYPWPVSLAGVRLLAGATALPLIYVSDTQINFYVPQSVATGTVTLTLVTPSGATAAASVLSSVLQPGIFPGAILRAGTTVNATATPVHAGDYIEIYSTGLGPTQAKGGLQQTSVVPTVFIGATPVVPLYSGLVPGLEGLYQVNVRIPDGLTPGDQPVMLSAHLAHSNAVTIKVQ